MEKKCMEIFVKTLSKASILEIILKKKNQRLFSITGKLQAILS
jgi:hypothetical protein